MVYFEMLVVFIFIHASLEGSINSTDLMSNGVCDTYTSLMTRLQDIGCAYRSFVQTHAYVFKDGVLSGSEVESAVEKTCSNRSAVEGYFFRCIENVTEECPEIQDSLINAVNAQISNFCNGTSVARWLSSVLQGEFSYSLECRSKIFSIDKECNRQVDNPGLQQMWESPVHEALDMTPGIMADFFQCTVLEAQEDSDIDSSCHMSWQDLLLTYYITNVDHMTFGFYLTENQMSQLQALRVE